MYFSFELVLPRLFTYDCHLQPVKLRPCSLLVLCSALAPDSSLRHDVNTGPSLGENLTTL